MIGRDLRLLVFNLATDVDHPILGFTTLWIRELAKRVSQVYVITMRAGRIEVPENVQVYSVGKEKGYSEPRRAVEFYRYLFRVLREGRIDACFSHMISIFSILAAPVLKARGIPLITWHSHPSLTWKLKLAHHLSDRMVASLPTAYPYRHDKLAVIGQGIDTDLFAPDGQLLPEEPPVILNVGRLSPVKGHLTLLKAASLLGKQCGDPFQVVIVGGTASSRDESYVRSLRAEVEALGLEERVHFEGPVPMLGLPRWYRRCTVHVNLAPTGFGDKVVWEAMACGRPCVVANEGFRETLGIYANSLLSRYADPEDLAERLSRMLKLPLDRRSEMGLYLRDRVLQMHGLDSLADKLVQLFREEASC